MVGEAIMRRFDCDTQWGLGVMEDQEDGEYVLFTDHQEIVGELVEALKSLYSIGSVKQLNVDEKDFILAVIAEAEGK